MRKILSVLLICILLIPTVFAEEDGSWECSFDGHVNYKAFCPSCGRSREEAAVKDNTCPSCGATDIEEGAAFCTNCGTKLTADNSAGAEPEGADTGAMELTFEPAATASVDPTATPTVEVIATPTPRPVDITVNAQIPTNPASDTTVWTEGAGRERVCLDEQGHEIYVAYYYGNRLSSERFSTYEGDKCTQLIYYSYDYATHEVESQYSYLTRYSFDENGNSIESFEYPCISRNTFKGIPSRHLVSTFDDKARKTGYVEYDANEAVVEICEYTLDDHGNTVNVVWKNANGIVTSESSREVDESGKMLSSVYTHYKEDGSVYSRSTSVYDSEGKELSSTYDSYDTDEWHSESKYVYSDHQLSEYVNNSYDGNGKLTNKENCTYSVSGATVIYLSYGEDGTTVKYKSEDSYSANGEMINSSWMSYSDAGKISSESATTYSGGVRQLERYTYYNEDGTISSLSTTTYNGDNPAFEHRESYRDDGSISSISDTTYDANGVKQRSSYVMYDAKGNITYQNNEQYDSNGELITPEPTATATPVPTVAATVHPTAAPVNSVRYTYDNLSYDIKKGGGNKSDVKKLQQALIDLGYLDGKADGSFGNKTKEAVTAFQRNNGIHSVEPNSIGIATTLTQAVLYSSEAIPAGSAPRNVTTNATDSDIAVSMATFSTNSDGSLQLSFALRNQHSTKAIVAYRVIYCVGTSKNYLTKVEGSETSSITISNEYIAPGSIGYANIKLDASSKEAKKISQIRFVIGEIVYEDGEVLIDYDASKAAYKIPAYALNLT